MGLRLGVRAVSHGPKSSTLIAGVDEVGRGPLFGPVVAAAVILPESCCLDGLNDSKKLSEEERERFDALVREVAVCWAVAEVDVQTIDRINILQASRLAMKIAVESLGTQPDHLHQSMAIRRSTLSAGSGPLVSRAMRAACLSPRQA